MSAPLILVAEDDADLRELVALTLMDEGFEVQQARNGREALDLVAARRPDLVLLDMSMPVLGGRGFADGLRLMADPPPVVVMTAGDRAAKSATEIGAVGWLPKPFDVDELVATVRRYLETRTGS